MSPFRILPSPAGSPPPLPPRDMYEGAACAGVEPRVFDGRDPGSVALAREICAKCPVAVRCLAWAMAAEPWGIWGGMTARERDRLRGWRLVAGIEEREEAAHLRRRLANGVPTTDIAAEYGVSRRTVERWRRVDLLGIEAQERRRQRRRKARAAEADTGGRRAEVCESGAATDADVRLKETVVRDSGIAG
jgi:WhiB family transcriptional regulator, redox-sensing transcriptional regulator